MAEQQIAPGHEAAMELVHQPLLLFLVKIDHDVPAEHRVEPGRPILVLQVVVIEHDEPAHSILYPQIAPVVLEVLTATAGTTLSRTFEAG